MQHWDQQERDRLINSSKKTTEQKIVPVWEWTGDGLCSTDIFFFFCNYLRIKTLAGGIHGGIVISIILTIYSTRCPSSYTLEMMLFFRPTRGHGGHWRENAYTFHQWCMIWWYGVIWLIFYHHIIIIYCINISEAILYLFVHD